MKWTIPSLECANNVRIPQIGFGTWKLGGALERDLSNDDPRDIRAIQSAIQMGLVHLDTAELYAGGYTEELVAQAIAGTPRNSLFLASKVKPTNLRKADVLTSAKCSLKRLRTDYLDLYYIHAVNPEIPLEETFEALNQLVREGLVRALAVSNFAVPSLQRAERLSETPIVANQVHYNLKFRGPERKGLLNYCRERKIAIIAWRPLQYGAFSEANQSELLNRLAQKYAKTPAQVAINWIISQPGVGTLFMSRNPGHIEENLGALGWNLSREDIETLRNDFPGQEPDSDRMPLT